MSATGSSGLLLERYAGIRSAVNAIRTRLIDSLTGPLNRALRARFNKCNVIPNGMVKPLIVKEDDEQSEHTEDMHYCYHLFCGFWVTVNNVREPTGDIVNTCVEGRG